MSSKKILVAEDSSVVQSITKRILESQHFEIVPAKNGLEVLSILESQHIDLILLDINMPKMNGIECASKIRAMNDPKKAEVPIVALTGNAQNLTAEEFKSLGINDYLPKPVDFDKLVEVVKGYTQ